MVIVWLKKKKESPLTDKSYVDHVLDMYEDVAVETVSSTAPNTDVSLDFSNRELAEQVCQLMKWESFNLFETHDFDSVINRNVRDELLAYAFISFLRWRMFITSQSSGIGIPSFNERSAAYSEMWYVTLVEAWHMTAPDAVPVKRWVH